MECGEGQGGANISDASFEAALEAAALASADRSESEGLFGPASPMWQLSREAFVFLLAGRATLLQTAHPFVASAIGAYSKVKVDPRDRFRRTFVNVFGMVFGTKEEALASARHVRRIHTHIKGTLPETVGRHLEGAPFSALDRHASEWVHATLTEGAMRACEMLKGPQTPDLKEAYWQDSLLFAALFGLSRADLPESWTAFEARFQETLESDFLGVGVEARDICDHLLKGAGKPAALPDWYIALTAGLLPTHLREGYGLTFGPLDRRRAEKGLARMQRFHRFLPEKIKYVPSYHKALARLDGKPAPDLLTRGLEKIWLEL